MAENLTWLGHASFKINSSDGKIIYIDPWQLKGDIEKADIVLITHSHYDHCSVEDIEKIRKDDTIIFASRDCKGKIRWDMKILEPNKKIEEKGITIETVPAYNIYKSFHPKTNLWLGYIVTVDGKRIYHAGDTDLIPEMDKIKADVMLVPVGGNYTMNAEEAAKAVNKIYPKLAIPMHFGNVVGSTKDAERFRTLCNVPVEILEQME